MKAKPYDLDTIVVGGMLTDLIEYGVIEDWYRAGDSWVIVDSGDTIHVLTTVQAYRSARRTLDRMEG